MIKHDQNKITATMKLVVTGEFYDDEATEETLRYCIEQDLEDAGFEVNVSLLKEQEAVKSKTISEELKQKMLNALLAEEDKFDKKYAGTKEYDKWFLIYRTWLLDGFNIAIDAIADWEGR